MRRYQKQWETKGWGASPYSWNDQASPDLLQAIVMAFEYLISPNTLRRKQWCSTVLRNGTCHRDECLDWDLFDHGNLYKLHPDFNPAGRGVIISQPYQTKVSPEAHEEFHPVDRPAAAHPKRSGERLLSADIGFIDFGKALSWYYPGRSHLVVAGARADVERLADMLAAAGGERRLAPLGETQHRNAAADAAIAELLTDGNTPPAIAAQLGLAPAYVVGRLPHIRQNRRRQERRQAAAE